MKEINLTMPSILFFLIGIGCFIEAYLYFKCKLSVRWRSGYFLAPKDEQKAPDFKAWSRFLAFTVFLGGIGANLLGLYQLYHLNWMKSAAMITGLVVIVSSAIATLIFGNREKRRVKKHSNRKRQSRQPESIHEDFSITEIRIDMLRFPIIFGCYVLLPLIVFAVVLSFVAQVPLSEFGDPTAQMLFSIFALILGLGCWILNKVLPKMTFSYHNGIFKIEKSGKTESFSVAAIDKLVMESPAMPDNIRFYLHNKKKPIKISMKGFKRDDRFDIPRKIVHITNTPLTRVEKKILDDFDD